MADPCPECGGSRHVWTKDGWRRCGCLKAERYSRRLADAGVPAYMESYTIERWAKKHRVAGRILPHVKSYLSDVVTRKPISRFRCLYGPAASGKLSLAFLFVKQCVRQGLTARVATLGEIVADRFGDRGELIEGVLQADLAVIRLGMEERHAWNSATLEKIHFARKMAERPVLYTTRVGVGSWADMYGPVMERAFWEPVDGDVVVWDLTDGRTVVP